MKKYVNVEETKKKGLDAHIVGFIIGILVLIFVFVAAELYMDYKDKVVRYYFPDGSYTDVVDGYYADATYPDVTTTVAPSATTVKPNN